MIKPNDTHKYQICTILTTMLINCCVTNGTANRQMQNFIDFTSVLYCTVKPILQLCNTICIFSFVLFVQCFIHSNSQTNDFPEQCPNTTVNTVYTPQRYNFICSKQKEFSALYQLRRTQTHLLLLLLYITVKVVFCT